MEALFWISLGVLAFTYLGYPVVLGLAALGVRGVLAAQEGFEPTLSLIIPVRDEALHIESKIGNCGELDCRAERMEILVVDDGSEDETVSLTRASFENLSSEREKSGGMAYLALRLLECGRPGGGKALALNRGCEEARGEILVFSDADCRIEREALRFLIRPFCDPEVGCVAGRYVAGGVRGKNKGGVGFYWRYENFLRRKESETGGVLGASGALYAVRRELYPSLKGDLINDDFVVPMSISLEGYRALYEPRAVAVEDESGNAEVEFRRRVRIMAGNCQHLLLFLGLWVKSRKRVRPLLQMFCHKFLRVLSPFCLIALVVSNVALGVGEGLYGATLAVQGAFYGLALTGLFVQWAGPWGRWASLPYYFSMLNVAALAGIWHFILGRGGLAWGRKRAL